MTPSEIIYKALSEHAGVTAIVGNRISPMMGLEQGGDPYITYQGIGCAPAYTQDEVQNMQDPAIQIDAWISLSGNWYATLEALGAAILNCLYHSESPAAQQWFFVTNTGTDFIEQESRKARRMFEITIWYDALL